jgi:hypothetical protein
VDDETELVLSDEHDAVIWVSYDEAMEMLEADNPSTDWLRHVLQRAEYIRKELPDSMIQHFRQTGFELG